MATTDPINAQLGAREFAAIAAIMQQEARIHLSEAKTTLVHSRLSRRMRAHGLGTFRDYVALVHANAEERAQMVTALTTNHTHFFREAHHFDHLRDHVMPSLKAKAARGDRVRIWSAGCSSGEEIYTLIMTLLGTERRDAEWVFRGDVKFLATDLSPPVVAAVARGQYSSMTVDPVPAAYRDRWMERQGEDYVVRDEVRQLVTARELNLFGTWPMRGQFDVIFCRNVMIYFDDTAQTELQLRFADALTSDGHLYIGHSERLHGDAIGRFTSCGQTIYALKGQN